MLHVVDFRDEPISLRHYVKSASAAKEAAITSCLYFALYGRDGIRSVGHLDGPRLHQMPFVVVALYHAATIALMEEAHFLLTVKDR